MKSFSTFLVALLICAIGAGLGIVGLWTLQARQTGPVGFDAEAAPLRAQIASLRSELEASRAKIAALEASAAAAKLAVGTRRFREARPDILAGSVDLGQGFEEEEPGSPDPIVEAPARDVKTVPADLPGAAPAAPPATKPVMPPALTEYMGRRVAPAMSFHGGGASWLLRRMREEEERTSVLIPELRLAPGMTVCDLGSGNGYHSLLMAKLVAPGGRVIAVDIQQEMLDQLKERATAAGVGNVETLLGEVHDPKLAANCCDLILLVDVYHEFSHPEHMLIAMRKALKPDGLVALVEFRGEDPNVPIKPEHKMTKAQIHKEWEASGYILAREFDKLPWQHLMFWKRK